MCYYIEAGESEVIAMRDIQPDEPPDLFKGSTESLLLSLINEQESTYGYRLIKEIEKGARGFSASRKGQFTRLFTN